MSQPQKPFACTIADCGMTFTNEDHLHVHTKKHDMVLTLGMEQKAAFVADQTPTPTRFIRNCEEVGLFQDLQNVNPFDEGFKRAMETKAGVLSLDGSLLTPAATDDVLHTPQMFYPTTEAENSLYNQRNIIISRSSSDESGAIKEYETTTISKLTNEVTTISRVIETTDQIYHNADLNKETNLKFTNNIVTIQSNLIKKDFDKFKSSVVASKVDGLKNNQNFTEISCKDVLLPNRCEVPPILSQKSLDYVVDSLTNDTFILESRLEPTGIGDKHVNDSFDNECIARNTRSNTTQLENFLKNKIKSIKKLKRPVNIRAKKSQEGKQIINVNLKATDEKKNDGLSGLEVIIKLPNQTYLKMRPVDELCSPDGSKLLTEYAKEKLRNNIEKKLGPANPNTASQNTSNQASNSNLPHILPNNIILPISSGTLIPVKIISPVTTAVLQANTIDDCSVEIENNIKTAEIIGEEHTKVKKHNKTKGVKRKKAEVAMKDSLIDKESVSDSYINMNDRFIDKQSDKGSINTDKVEVKSDIFKKTERQDLLERKSAASKRYRQNFKSKIESQRIENDKLKQINMKLKEENARLKSLIIEHASKCSNPANLPVFKVNPI